MAEFLRSYFETPGRTWRRPCRPLASRAGAAVKLSWLFPSTTLPPRTAAKTPGRPAHVQCTCPATHGPHLSSLTFNTQKPKEKKRKGSSRSAESTPWIPPVKVTLIVSSACSLARCQKCANCLRLKRIDAPIISQWVYLVFQLLLLLFVWKVRFVRSWWRRVTEQPWGRDGPAGKWQGQERKRSEDRVTNVTNFSHTQFLLIWLTLIRLNKGGTRVLQDTPVGCNEPSLLLVNKKHQCQIKPVLTCCFGAFCLRYLPEDSRVFIREQQPDLLTDWILIIDRVVSMLSLQLLLYHCHYWLIVVHLQLTGQLPLMDPGCVVKQVEKSSHR